jgi:hypothetical protein
MARETRRGPIAAAAGAIRIGMTYKEARAQTKLEKQRKKFEAKKKKENGCASGGDRVSRSQTMLIDALYPAVPLPPIPSPPQPTQRRTRQDKPSCTDFGPMRHAQFNRPPKWFFCAECDAWDRDKDVVPRIKQTSRRYKCIAGHTSFDFPTAPARTKAKVMQRGKNLVETIRRLEFEDSTTDLLEDTGVDLEAAETSDPNILTVIK